MTTLESIQLRAQQGRDQAPGDVLRSIYSIIYDLTGEVILSGSPREVDDLRKQNTKLRADLDSLNGLLNYQASVLQQIKDALEAPSELTMTQLPALAKSILAWAKTGHKP